MIMSEFADIGHCDVNSLAIVYVYTTYANQTDFRLDLEKLEVKKGVP